MIGGRHHRVQQQLAVLAARIPLPQQGSAARMSSPLTWPTRGNASSSRPMMATTRCGTNRIGTSVGDGDLAGAEIRSGSARGSQAPGRGPSRMSASDRPASPALR